MTDKNNQILPVTKTLYAPERNEWWVSVVIGGVHFKTERRGEVEAQAAQDKANAALRPTLLPPHPTPESDLKKAIEYHCEDLPDALNDLLDNKNCSCGGWTCPRCVLAFDTGVQMLRGTKYERPAAPPSQETSTPTPALAKDMENQCEIRQYRGRIGRYKLGYRCQYEAHEGDKHLFNIPAASEETPK